MVPPRETLQWDEIVQYASLADFDLLRDARQDIRNRPWASHASRRLTNQYFKLLRAEEDITRLNTEIPRVITHLHDEDRFLASKAQEVEETNPHLAHYIRQYRLERTRFNAVHFQRFNKLASHPQFSGSLTPGNPVNKELRVFSDADFISPSIASPSSSSESQQGPTSKTNDDGDEPEDDREEIFDVDEDDIDALSETLAIMFAAVD